MTRSPGDAGSVSAFVAVIAIGLIMVTGLVYDGGQVLAAQATARDLAAKAARAGAQELDLDALRAHGKPWLDPDRAAGAANAFLEDSGAEGDVAVAGADVTVTVRVVARMRILPVPDRTVQVSDRATATTGVRERDPGA